MKSTKILVVEDENIVAIDIKRRLANLGYDVVGVLSSGEEAVLKCGELGPDLILMDIMLEGKIDGIEAAVQIKHKYSVPVIFLTAYTDEKTIQRAKIAEPFGYILKPFEVRDLRSTIEIAIYKASTQRQLKESEQWLNVTLKSIGDAVIAIDSDKKIKFMNPLAEKLTEISQTEAIGKQLDEVYKVVNEISDEDLICLLSNSLPERLEDLLKSKMLIAGDSMIPIEDSQSEIKNDNGDIIGSVITFRDVSKRRAVEAAIVASRNYYLSLFEEFPTLIWRTGDDGRFNYFNHEWLEFTGRNIENEIEFGWMERLYEEDKPLFMNAFQNAFEKRGKFECEMRLQNSHSEYRWLICFGSPYYDLDKKFMGYIGACYDITERKVVENEMKIARDKAEEASKAKTTFLSNMSHELRTPMNGVIGLTEILMETELTGEQRNYLGLLRKSAFALLNLLNSILDFSKYESGKLKPEKSGFNLGRLVDEVAGLFRAETQNKGIDLSYNVDSQIPQELFGDHQRLRQVIMNLMSNAVKFTEKGKISLAVSKARETDLILNKNKITLLFSVHDTGIGIEKEKQKLVFESFTQADSSTTKKYAGTGIGLTIAKQIVEMLEGKIWLESQPNVGSAFHFTAVLDKNTR
ncbi:MAG: ATP-binding protein [Syntrophothermus sp.]